MPDIFVPQDTVGYTSYYYSVANNRLPIEFAFQYTDTHRKTLSEYEGYKSLLSYLKRQNLVERFVRFAEERGVKRRNLLIGKSYKLLERTLYGNIIYNMMGTEQYVQFLNQDDPTVKKALQVLRKGEAFPKAPTETKADAK